MSSLIAVVGLVLVAVVLHDGFETMLLPRRVGRTARLTRLYYLRSWPAWRWLATRPRDPKRRSYLLSVFGPLSFLGLFGIWASGLIVGFALIHSGLATPMTVGEAEPLGFGGYLYFSGVTFFTLGYGDVAPVSGLGRGLAVAEVGVGYAFLAMVISYLPVFYQAYATRELAISLLDARAGSPPTAGSLLLRLAPSRDLARLEGFLVEWERWAAQLLESHISFPLLSFYRSQHDNQSWLATLATILDTSSLCITGLEGHDPYQGRLTFAMARHAVVDLAQIYDARPVAPESDRLAPDRLTRLMLSLKAAGMPVRDGAVIAGLLGELRGTYEPFLEALARSFDLVLPPVWAESRVVDNWQTSAYMKRTSEIGQLASLDPDDDHAD